MERKTVLKIGLWALLIIPLAFLFSLIFFPHPIDHCCPYNPQNGPAIRTNTSQYYDPVWNDSPYYDPIWGYWVRTDDENQYYSFSSLGTFEQGFRTPQNLTGTGQWTKLDTTIYLLHPDNESDVTITYNSSTDLLTNSNEKYQHFQPRQEDEKRYRLP